MPPEELAPFPLFCAYHLGLTAAGTVRHANVHEVARRFGVSTDDVHRALEAWGMSPARMLELDFDLAAARHDLEVSPPGVDLPGLARMHWELFLAAPERPRDWEAERAEDERINRATFGDKSLGDETLGDQALGDQALGDQALSDLALGDEARRTKAPRGDGD